MNFVRIISITFLILIFFNFSSLCLAGNEKGNGGYAVICKNPSPPYLPYEILDFTEGRLLRELTPDLGPKELSTFEKVEFVLKRLEFWAPSRVRLYRQWATEFLQEAKFLKGVELGDIGDTDHIAIPEGCILKPVINQREPTIPNEKRYFINQDLWDRLNADNQAGLILHEFIYRELKTPTSIKVRYYNSIISSRLLEKLPLSEVIQVHLNTGLRSLDIHGVEVNLTLPIQFHPNQVLKSAYPIGGSLFNFKGQAVKLYDLITESDLRSPRIEFYESGALKSFIPKDPLNIKAGTLSLQLLAYHDRPIEFWPNNNIKTTIAKVNNEMNLKTPYVNIEIGLDPYSNTRGNVELSFYENEAIASISNGSGQALVQDQWVSVSRGFGKLGIELFEKGFLKSGSFKDPVKIILNNNIFFITGQSFFFPNRNLFFGYLSREQYLNQQNKKLLFKSHPEPVEFYENGALRCGYLAKKEILETTASKKPQPFSYIVCFTPEGLVDPKLQFSINLFTR